MVRTVSLSALCRLPIRMKEKNPQPFYTETFHGANCKMAILNTFHLERVIIEIDTLGKLNAFIPFLQGFVLLCIRFYF